MAKILSGKELSKEIRAKVSEKVEQLKKSGLTPSLAIILATDNEASKTYVRIISKAAEKIGINAKVYDLGVNPSYQELESTIKKLAEDESVHGIILQAPVPENIDIDKLRSLIPLNKDVDGANPLSAGMLFSDLPSFAPATSAVVIRLLQWHGIEIAGKNAVVIGRSRIVGKPVAHLLMNLDATVTSCHKETKNIKEIVKQADILVVATGVIGLVTEDWVNPNMVIVDVGTNFNEEGKLVGDVVFDEVTDKVAAISPVPGGIGPITTAILLKNTAQATDKANFTVE